jgi:hypothetical protein
MFSSVSSCAGRRDFVGGAVEGAHSSARRRAAFVFTVLAAWPRPGVSFGITSALGAKTFA